MRGGAGDRLNLNTPEREHVCRGILHDKDVVAARAVEARGLKGGDRGSFYSKARLAGGAHHNDVRRWSFKS
jgi:hypothetical protein